MPRSDRPKATSRSEHRLRVAVIDKTHWFDERVRDALCLNASERIDSLVS